MPEWLVEHGIGQVRAALVEDGTILEARIEHPRALIAGTVYEAQLKDIGQGGRNARAAIGRDIAVLLPDAPAGVTEGGRFNLELTREHLGGLEPWKLPLGRATDAPAAPPPPLEQRLPGRVRILQFPSAGRDELDEAGWSELLEQAVEATVRFPGGELNIFRTPAMTLIDVDGSLPTDDLAIAAAIECARAIRRLGIAGSIGIDFPTIAGKAGRQAVAAAIDEQLPKPFERTAMNGFGFLQIVRPLARPSLLDLAAQPQFEAATLVREAARMRGAITLVANASAIDELKAHPDWLEALARQVGGGVGLRVSPSLPKLRGHAQSA